jgi:hypothetical protein
LFGVAASPAVVLFAVASLLIMTAHDQFLERPI